MVLMWVQANKTAENVAGFVDIILTQALSMANSLPDIANPLSVIGGLFRADMPPDQSPIRFGGKRLAG